jgi:hypothetical protein
MSVDESVDVGAVPVPKQQEKNITTHGDHRLTHLYIMETERAFPA